MTDASRYFEARPAEGGGVRLRLRHRFRDIMGTYIEEDGVARSRVNPDHFDDFLPGKRRARDQDSDENGDDPTRQTIHTFGPLLPSQRATLEQQPSGVIAVVVISPPDEILGNTINSGGTTSAKINAELGNQGPTHDRRSSYLTSTLRGEPKKLANMNAANKRYFGR